MRCFITNDFIPVIAPLGIDDEGKTYNINADNVAGVIAHSLNAKRLLVLTDVEGVKDKEDNIIEELTKEEAETLAANKSIFTGGMLQGITNIEATPKWCKRCCYCRWKRVKHAVL